jgi:glycogen synthase
MGNPKFSVLQIGPFPPPHGGVAANLVAIRGHLRANGLPAGVVNVVGTRRDNADEVWYPNSASEVVRLLIGLPYRILHLHLGGEPGNRILGLCLAVTSIPGKPSVLTFHSGGYPSSPAGKTASPWTLRGFVFRRFDRIICVNSEMVKMFQRFGVRPDRIRLILPFALPKKLPREPLTPALASFFSHHESVIVSVNGLEPEYDVGRQIDAFEAIYERHGTAGLAIIGSGSLEAKLRVQLAGKSYRDHVLICGDVPHAITLRAVYESALAWRTTLYDGDAVSVREALHLGVPVIATDNQMRPPGVILVPIGDTAALQSATCQILAQPRAKNRQLQGSESNMECTLDLYREIAGAD